MFSNRYFGLLTVFLLFGSFLFGGILAPPKDEMDISNPFFKYKIYSYPVLERDSIHVKINMNVPYNELQFIKYKGKFRAIYEGSILVIGPVDKQSFSKVWIDTIVVETYEETNVLKSFSNNEIKFSLPPDKYTFKFGIRDVDSKKKQYYTKKYDYRDYYKDSIIISEMKLTEEENEKEQNFEEADIFADSTESNKRLFNLEYKVLSKGGDGKITYKIKDLKKNIVFDKTYDYTFEDGVTDVSFVFDAKKLHYKEYKLIAELELDGEKADREKSFHVRWTGMNFFIRNLEEAIEQLVYISDSKTLKKMRNAKSEEQKELFLEFWKAKDPTPGTMKNELMNEYYSRMRYANAHFQGHRNGWRSDMGMIFVLFGAPDNIERHPFEINSRPYEVWYYNTKSKVFYFVDDTGFGDYRLINSNNIYY